MPINLSQLSQAGNTAVTLSNLILVTPQQNIGIQAQNAPSYEKNTEAQAPTLLFNYNGEEQVSIQSDITDHYIETNSAIQDQIALKPITYTVEGFVGELNDIVPKLLEPLKIAADKLTTIPGYVPQLSTVGILAYANALQAYQIAKAVKNNLTAAWSSINGGGGVSVINGAGAQSKPNQTQQQIYFQQIASYIKKRTLFTVQTPWAIFQDMAIMDFKAIQSGETRMITDFKITFKMLQFASTQLVGNTLYDYNNLEGRAADQGSPEVDLGTSQLQQSTTSFASNLA